MNGWTGEATELPVGRNVVRYVDAGSGPPVVWIHGGAVNLEMWAPQLERFGETHRVVAYDMRGHGGSQFDDNEPDDIEDLGALLDELDLACAQVVGLSMGAVIALDFVLAYPERVERLALLSPGLIGVQERDESYLEPIMAIGAAVESDDLDAAMAVIERMTFEGRRRLRVAGLDEARAYLDRTVRDYFARGDYKRLPRLREPDPSSRLGEIDAPTLIVHGAHDLEYIANNVRVLAAGIPEATVVEIADAGHMLNVERASYVNETLAAFLFHSDGMD